MKSIFIVYEIYDCFTLWEALNWVAFKAIPYGDDDYFGHELFFHNHRMVFPADIGFEPVDEFPPSFIGLGKPPQSRETKEMMEWDEAFMAATDESRALLFATLKKGELKARGVHRANLRAGANKFEWAKEEVDIWDYIPDPYLESPETKFYSDRKKYEVRAEFIPPAIWRSEGVNWEESRANFQEKQFAEITVNRDELFKAFPPPPKITTEIQTIAGYLIPEDGAVYKSNPKKRLGRPPAIDWHAFDVELMKVIMNESKLIKQESLIVLMQEWCLRVWGKSPQRSTVLERVSPFLKAIKSENP